MSAKLIIFHDKTGRLSFESAMAEMPDYIRPGMAQLSVPDDLEGKDIYEIARKLAELLLEQL